MDFVIELILIAALLLLGNTRPQLLVDFAHSTLGKVVLVVTVILTAKIRGLTSGLLAALIFVILLHSYREGLGCPRDCAKEGGSCNKVTGLCEGGGYDKNKKPKPKHKLPPLAKPKNTKPYSTTNRVDNENALKRGAEEGTLSASKQANDHTNQ